MNDWLRFLFIFVCLDDGIVIIVIVVVIVSGYGRNFVIFVLDDVVWVFRVYLGFYGVVNKFFGVIYVCIV